MAEQRVTAKAAAKQATRAALLRAATEMLFEAPAADPIGALKPMEVCRRAVPPRSNGAFYNIWPTQADFRRDLLHHVLSLERVEATDPTAEILARLVTAPDFSLVETLRVAANLSFEGFQDDAAMRLRQALWSRHTSDPEVKELLVGQYANLSELMTPLYAALLERSGRRMRRPYTLEHLTVVIAALFEGLSLRAAVDPEAVADVVSDPGADERGSRWTLAASVTYLIVLGMSEPA